MKAYVTYISGLIERADVPDDIRKQVNKLLNGKLLLSFYSNSKVINAAASIHKTLENNCKLDERKGNFPAEDELLSTILEIRKNISQNYDSSNKGDNEKCLKENLRVLFFCNISEKLDDIGKNSACQGK